MNQALKVVLIAALLIIVVRLLEAQTPIVAKDSLLVNGHPIYGEAYVDCDSVGTPTIYTTHKALVASWWPQMYVHEMTHVRQMKESGQDCIDYVHRFNLNKDFRLKIESEAYCAGARFTYGEDWSTETPIVVTSLYEGYALDISKDSIQTVFTRICKEAPNGRQRQAAPP